MADNPVYLAVTTAAVALLGVVGVGVRYGLKLGSFERGQSEHERRLAHMESHFSKNIEALTAHVDAAILALGVRIEKSLDEIQTTRHTIRNEMAPHFTRLAVMEAQLAGFFQRYEMYQKETKERFEIAHEEMRAEVRHLHARHFHDNDLDATNKCT